MSSDRFEVNIRSKGYVGLPPDGDLFVDHEYVKGVDYSALGLKSFGSHGSRFENCNFQRLRLGSLSFGEGKVLSEYINCSFDGSKFPASTGVGRARFINCTFRHIQSSRFRQSAGDLIGCEFSGRMGSTQIWGRTGPDASIYGERANRIEGNDFSGVDFSDIDFRFGVDLCQQVLPTGLDYLFIPDAADVLAAAYKDVVTMDDLEKRKALIGMIQVRQDALGDGQRDLFESKRRVPKFLRADYEAFFSVITKHLGKPMIPSLQIAEEENTGR